MYSRSNKHLAKQENKRQFKLALSERELQNKKFTPATKLVFDPSLQTVFIFSILLTASCASAEKTRKGDFLSVKSTPAVDKSSSSYTNSSSVISIGEIASQLNLIARDQLDFSGLTFFENAYNPVLPSQKVSQGKKSKQVKSKKNTEKEKALTPKVPCSLTAEHRADLVEDMEKFTQLVTIYHKSGNFKKACQEVYPGKRDSDFEALLVRHTMMVRHLAGIKKLVEHQKLPVTIQIGKYQEPILVFAATVGDLKIFKYLFKIVGADATQRNSLGHSPLLEAAYQGHLSIVKFWPNKTTADLFDAFYGAAKGGSINVLRYLVKDLKISDQIKNAFTTFHKKNERAHSPLSIAVQCDRPESVKYLLDQANVRDQRDFAGRSTLEKAVIEGRLEIVKSWTIISDLDDPIGLLLLAAKYDRLEILQHLIKKQNISLDMQWAIPKIGTSSLLEHLYHLALDNNAKKIKDYLEELGYSEWTSTQKSMVSAALALLTIPAGVVAYRLRRMPAYLWKTTVNSTYALYTRWQKYKNQKMLKEPDLTLRQAANNNDLSLMKRLLKNKNFNIDSLEEGETALYAAASAGHVNIVECLIAHEADVSIKCHDYTSLQAAVINGHLPVVKYLIEQAKANVFVKAKQGQTMLALAKTAEVKTFLEPFFKPKTVKEIEKAIESDPFVSWSREIEKSIHLVCDKQKDESISLTLNTNLFKDPVKTENFLNALLEGCRREISSKQERDFSCALVNKKTITFDQAARIHMNISAKTLCRLYHSTKKDLEEVMSAEQSKQSQAQVLSRTISRPPVATERKAEVRKDSSVEIRQEKKSIVSNKKQETKVEFVFVGKGISAPKPDKEKTAADEKPKTKTKPKRERLSPEQGIDNAFFHQGAIAVLVSDEVYQQNPATKVIRHFALLYHLVRYFVLLQGRLPSQKEDSHYMRHLVIHYILNIIHDESLVLACSRDILDKKLSRECIQYFSPSKHKYLKPYLQDAKAGDVVLNIQNTLLYQTLQPVSDKADTTEIKDAQNQFDRCLSYIKNGLDTLQKKYMDGKGGWFLNSLKYQHQIQEESWATLDALKILLMLCGELAGHVKKQEISENLRTFFNKITKFRGCVSHEDFSPSVEEVLHVGFLASQVIQEKNIKSIYFSEWDVSVAGVSSTLFAGAGVGAGAASLSEQVVFRQ